jgi:hypothetical protein
MRYLQRRNTGPSIAPVTRFMVALDAHTVAETAKKG